MATCATILLRLVGGLAGARGERSIETVINVDGSSPDASDAKAARDAARLRAIGEALELRPTWIIGKAGDRACTPKSELVAG